MHPLVNIAQQAARSAGRIIVRHIQQLDRITIDKKGQNDFVTEIDRLAETEIINTIHKAYPDHGIFAEESGKPFQQDAAITWIIDPLDGTTNFIHDMPHYCVSIAVQEKQTIQHGVIYDPIRDELFSASRGQGAYMNNRRLRVSKQKQLAGSLLGTGFPYSRFNNLDAYMKSLAAIIPQVAGIRRAGSAALDLAYVAAGRFDGFWELGLKPWDIAAGALLVKEAGGLITDFSGQEKYLENGDIVAANPKLLKLLLQHFKPTLGPISESR